MFSSPPYPTVVRMGNPFSLIIKLFTTDLWKFTYPSYLQCQSCFIFWVLLPYSPKKKKKDVLFYQLWIMIYVSFWICIWIWLIFIFRLAYDYSPFGYRHMWKSFRRLSASKEIWLCNLLPIFYCYSLNGKHNLLTSLLGQVVLSFCIDW